jgi:hypothetical protein
MLMTGHSSWKMGLSLLKDSGPGTTSYLLRVKKDKDSMDFLLKRLDVTYVIA